MKKGDYLKITSDAKYDGQDMRWTETFKEKITLKAGTMLYHSSDKKISEFLSKETCFFLDDRMENYCYVAVLKKDVVVDYYESQEVRLEINENNCSIQYVGTIRYIPTLERDKKYGCPIYKKVDRTIRKVK